ncbi:Mediator of RNA polymerase II transcription subunit 7 [Cercospora zeina]
MAEEQHMVAAFPLPPPFYEHFTKDNLERLEQLRKELNNGEDNAAKRDIDVLSIPPELRYLIPPSPPATSKFTVFGNEIDLEAPEPSLEDAGIDQLYPDDPSVKTNPQPHLIALARSMLTTFLGLLGILGQNPTLYEERITDLQAIVFNMHSLINQYRPHQARETLITLMEDRVEKMRAEIRGIEEGKERVTKLLEGMRQGEHAYADDSDIKLVNGNFTKKDPEAKRKARQRATWDMLEAEVG